VAPKYLGFATFHDGWMLSQNLTFVNTAQCCLFAQVALYADKYGKRRSVGHATALSGKRSGLSVETGLLFQALDFILQQQFLALHFGQSEIIHAEVDLGRLDFLFENRVTPNEFGKMRR
jgi:hypothetical protein